MRNRVEWFYVIWIVNTSQDDNISAFPNITNGISEVLQSNSLAVEASIMAALSSSIYVDKQPTSEGKLCIWQPEI